MEVSILDFGAISDSITDNQKAIQQAIDLCNNNGGGRVIIPEGHFRTSSIILKSHVDFHLEQGALLEGVDDIKSYMTFDELASKSLNLDETPTWENCEYTGRPSQFFIYSKDASHVMISGTGIIDGNEKIFYGNRHKGFIEGSYYPRIPLIFFENVKHLIIRDVTLQKSGFWTTHLVGCSYVLIDSVKIFNNLEMANCDGIDPDHCKHMEIRNCYIEAADDAIVFKNTEGAKKYGACEYIKVHDCKLITTSAGIKFGTESVSDFRHISISKITIEKASRGISFQLRDEGNIENISFSNIHIQSERHTPGLWWGTGEPIYISAVKRHENSQLGHIKQLSFKNINMIGENGIVIYGEETSLISHITFNNCKLNLQSISEYPKVKLDLRPTTKPDIIEDTAHFLKLKYANHITFKHFLYSSDEDFKPYIKNEFDIEASDAIKIDGKYV